MSIMHCVLEQCFMTSRLLLGNFFIVLSMVPFTYRAIIVFGFDYSRGSQGSLLFVTYIIIQGIIGSEMLIRTGPLNGKCKKIKKIKHNNNIKAIKTMKQNTREYIYIYKYGENEIRDK